MSADLISTVESASQCIQRHDYNKARDRLRSVLLATPDYLPALKLMGQIYYERGDCRNAVLYWARAGYWEPQMESACAHVLRAACRALRKEREEAARYQLLAFVGSAPPRRVGEQLSRVQSAFFSLDEKQCRQTGLTCTPIAGVCLLLALGLLSGLLQTGWSTFVWLEWIAAASTGIVLMINICKYIRACKAYRREISSLCTVPYGDLFDP